MSKLIIKCITINEPKRSSFIQLTDWSKCQIVTINMNNIDDSCFQYAFILTQDIWNGEKHPTVTDNHKNYALFEKNMWELFYIL